MRRRRGDLVNCQVATVVANEVSFADQQTENPGKAHRWLAGAKTVVLLWPPEGGETRLNFKESCVPSSSAFEVSMPLARVIASSPEEAIPVVERLRAQGYEIEVIAPGEPAETPAELEITVENCDVEQALEMAEQFAVRYPEAQIFFAPDVLPADQEKTRSWLSRAASRLFRRFRGNRVDWEEGGSPGAISWNEMALAENDSSAWGTSQEPGLSWEPVEEQDALFTEAPAWDAEPQPEVETLSAPQQAEIARRAREAQARREEQERAYAAALARQQAEQREAERLAQQREAEIAHLARETQARREEQERAYAEALARQQEEQREAERLAQEREAEIARLTREAQVRREEQERAYTAALARQAEERRVEQGKSELPSFADSPDRESSTAKFRRGPMIVRSRRVQQKARSRRGEWLLAGAAAMGFAVVLMGAWSLVTSPRPAAPLQIQKSNGIEQQVPFGPATIKNSPFPGSHASPSPRTQTPAGHTTTKPPASFRSRASTARGASRNAVHRRVPVDPEEDDVVVHHYTTPDPSRAGNLGMTSATTSSDVN